MVAIPDNVPSPQGNSLWQKLKSYLGGIQEGARFAAETQQRAEKWEKGAIKTPPSPIVPLAAAPPEKKQAGSLFPAKRSNSLKERAVAHATAFAQLKGLQEFEMEKIGSAFIVVFPTSPEMAILMCEPHEGGSPTHFGTGFKMLDIVPTLKNPELHEVKAS